MGATSGALDRMRGGGFNRVWAAATVSNLGDGMLLAAVPLLVATLTRDPVVVAGATVAGQLPWLLFALPSGALVDRWDRRRVMLAADGVRAVVVLGLAAAAIGAGAPATILVVYAVAFVLASAETLFDPASEALIATIVPRDALASANSRLQVTTWLTNIVLGPALGALLFGIWAGLPFIVDAVTFIIAVALVATLRGLFRSTAPRETRAPLTTEIADGLRWLAAHRLLRSLAVSAGVINLVTLGVVATFVLYARDVLDVSGSGYGFLLSAVGAGGLIGATLAPRAIRTLGPGRAIRAGLGLGALAALAMSLTTDVVVVVVASLGFGVMLTFWNVVVITLRQRVVPDELRGRVMSVYRLLAWGTQPLGALLGGVIAAATSLQAVLAVAAVVYAVVALATLGFLGGRELPEQHAPVEPSLAVV